MKTFSQFMLAALLIICGSTMFTSCTSSDDNPAVSPVIPAKQIVGEWIIEMHVDGIEPINIDDKIEFPADANGFALIYHFNDDGKGWKEMNILKDGEPVFVPFDRYSCNFVYSLNNQGVVTVDFVDEEDQPTEESDVLGFDGISLTCMIDNVKTLLNRATEEQIKKYRDLAEEWHGGSDESNHAVTGVSNDGWKWVNELPATEKDR